MWENTDQKNSQYVHFSHSVLLNMYQTRSLSYNWTNFLKSSVRYSQYNLNSLRCFALKVWGMVQLEIKKIKILPITFKEKSVSSPNHTYRIQDMFTGHKMISCLLACRQIVRHQEGNIKIYGLLYLFIYLITNFILLLIHVNSLIAVNVFMT